MLRKHAKDQRKKIHILAIATSAFVAGASFYSFFSQHVPPSPSGKVSAVGTVESVESLEVCFTPNQSCLPEVLKAIHSAQSSIVVLGYSFTSKPIVQALIKAKKRGVNVRIVLDHSQKYQKYSKAVIQTLLKEHIDVRFDHSVKIAHNKIIVIDNLQTLGGSYNWTQSAEFNNAENLIFIKSNAIAKKYSTYFEERWNVSRPYFSNQ